MIIRREEEKDYRMVEEMTKKAFWNVHVPGCVEHYLTHLLRKHEDFIPELDFVIEEHGRIIGNIMFVKSKLVSQDGEEKEILTFGPLSIHPDYQRKGYGKKLLNYALEKAEELGHEVIVILGNPENYVTSGFKNCKKYKVGLNQDLYPVALLVKELKEGILANKEWTFVESHAYEFDETEVEKFDQTFEYMEKEYRPSQELFSIYSRAIMNG